MLYFGNLCKNIFYAFFIGFAISIPLGPSGIESVNRCISKNFYEGFKVSVGAVIADITYLIIINLGLFNFITNRFEEGLFWIISGIILIIFNYFSNKNCNNSKLIKMKVSNGFLSGFLITFINPMTPSLWLAISGTIINSWRLQGITILLFSIIFLIIGSLSWFLILNLLATKGFKFLKKNITKKTSSILNYVLLFLGIVFIILGLIKILGGS